jgi:hypothetical protein
MSHLKDLTLKEKKELASRDFYLHGKDLYVKVVQFPLDEVQTYKGVTVSHESMWVKSIEGDEYKGKGILMNKPSFSNCVAGFGDLIAYSDGGDKDKRPHFVEVIAEAH